MIYVSIEPFGFVELAVPTSVDVVASPSVIAVFKSLIVTANS